LGKGGKRYLPSKERQIQCGKGKKETQKNPPRSKTYEAGPSSPTDPNAPKDLWKVLGGESSVARTRGGEEGGPQGPEKRGKKGTQKDG